MGSSVIKSNILIGLSLLVLSCQGQTKQPTSTNRTSWADNRDKLLSLGGTAMEEALKELESGAFVVNLDDTDPPTLDEHSEMLLTGGTVSADNRWFDKSLQLIVANNGTAGGGDLLFSTGTLT